MKFNETTIADYFALYAGLGTIDEKILKNKVNQFEKKHGLETIFTMPGVLINDNEESFLCRALNLKQYRIAVYLVENFFLSTDPNIEEKIVDTIQQISSAVEGGIDWLLSVKLTLIYVYEKKNYSTLFLSLMIAKKYENVIKKIAELGKLKDASLTLLDPTDDQAVVNVNAPPTLLYLAISVKSTMIVDLILTHDLQANLLFKSINGSLLTCVNSVAIAHLLIEGAKKRNQLDNLLRLEEVVGRCVFSTLLLLKKYEIVDVLFQLDGWQRFARERLLWHTVCFEIFTSTGPHEVLDKYYQFLKGKISALPRLKFEAVDWIANYERCIEQWKFQVSACAEEKVKEIYYLVQDHFYFLSQPKECNPYLVQLSEEAARYYQETHKGKSFPVLNRDSYEFKEFEELPYPVPKPTFNGIIKDRTLQKYLIAFFRKFGIAENIYKWIGYIPHEHADPMMANGDFIIESRIGIILFHSHLGHMVQHWLLIVRLLMSGKWNKEVLPLKEILHYLVYGQNVWATVRDKRIKGGRVSYTDPFILVSVIMFYGNQWGMRVLADSFTDSICAGLIKYWVVYNMLYQKNISLSEFVERHQDFFLNMIGALEKEAQYEIALYKNTRQVTMFSSAAAAVKLDIPIDPKFEPRMNFK